MSIWTKIKKSPWRIFILLFIVIGILFFAYTIWSPGQIITDGRHDLKTNGIWLQHGWLGHDSWFKQYRKDPNQFRNVGSIQSLAKTLKKYNITDVYPHLCPCNFDGRIALYDTDQTNLFIKEMQSFRIMPWIGGVLDVQVKLESVKWRKKFVESTVRLLKTYPTLSGVHINIEPLPSGNADFLTLLDELKQAMPTNTMLSVAAYPPPTVWHRFPEVHWEENYFTEVAKRSDQMVVMMYDTSIKLSKPYRKLMEDWTQEALTWANGTSVLLGIPVYDDEGVGYHFSNVENIEHALAGIHAGLSKFKSLPSNYQGIAIYCEWEMQEEEWRYLSENYISRK
jgi:glycosyl hydrolase family 18 (putative chitinase)